MAQMDDVFILSAVTTRYVTGSTGFVSAGVGTFDNAILSTLCDGGSQCVGAQCLQLYDISMKQLLVVLCLWLCGRT